MDDARVYAVPRMSCGSCKARVSGALDGVDGVDAYEVDLVNRLVFVSGEGVQDATVLQVLEGIGYPGELVQG